MPHARPDDRPAGRVVNRGCRRTENRTGPIPHGIRAVLIVFLTAPRLDSTVSPVHPARDGRHSGQGRQHISSAHAETRVPYAVGEPPGGARAASPEAGWIMATPITRAVLEG